MDGILIRDQTDFVPTWYDIGAFEPVYEPMPTFNPQADCAIIALGLGVDSHTNSTNIDLRGRHGLLVSIKEIREDTIFVTSLYHLRIAPSEEGSGRLLNAACAVRFAYQAVPDQYKRTILNQTCINLFDNPLNKAAMNYWLSKSSGYAEWNAASEELQNDWMFRATKGDVLCFKRIFINIWLNLYSPAVRL